MPEIALIIAALAGSTLGGALAARQSRAPLWKGAVIAGLAPLIQLAIAMALDIDNYFLIVLIFLVVVGLIGGRWGLGLSARQLALVVVGSVLFALLFGVGALYLLLGLLKA